LRFPRRFGTVSRVTSDDLTTEQARRVGAGVGRYLKFLGRLRHRITRLAFSTQNPLLVSVTKAWNETHELSVRLHSCHLVGGGKTTAAGQLGLLSRVK
jgi:hypothetical protein